MKMPQSLDWAASAVGQSSMRTGEFLLRLCSLSRVAQSWPATVPGFWGAIKSGVPKIRFGRIDDEAVRMDVIFRLPKR
jgi:hypothetical protein